MEILRKSNENEMILEFFKGELDSNRFNKELKEMYNEGLNKIKNI